MDFRTYITRHINWSRTTFGDRNTSAGVIAHLRKELIEVEEAPSDLEEWIDLIILAIDGAQLEGYDATDIIAALLAKQHKNTQRIWPDQHTLTPGQPIEHIKKELTND